MTHGDSELITFNFRLLAQGLITCHKQILRLLKDHFIGLTVAIDTHDTKVHQHQVRIVMQDQNA